VRLCILLLPVWALPCTAAAQTWKAAYDAGQFNRAAVLLHEIVTDAEAADSGDSQPFARLGDMYARGKGVSRDPIAACALFQLASIADAQSGGTIDGRPIRTIEDYEAREARTRQVQRPAIEHCNKLSDDDRLAAMRSTGCLAFGMPEDEITLGGQTLRIGRLGIRPAGKTVHGFGLSPCLASTYVMAWQLYESIAGDVTEVALETVGSAGAWPQGDAVPEVSIEMIRSGHVRWRIDGAPPKRGWIMLPDKKDSR
jgi:hypothetical protein